MKTPILTVNKIGKSFKDKRIIKNISFQVFEGEIMALLGPNGAGKSTTIRSIMGILYPDEGTIHFNRHGEGEIPRQKIGYLPEERGLYKKVSIMDILLYFAELKDYPLKKARERALFYLKKFGLEGKEKSTIEEFSKGMAQKVQFIAAIIHEPELLILDEPFSGLDPVSQDVIKNEIRNLASNGTAILLSAHQMNVVEELCDRLLMIHRGEKVIAGTMEEVKTEYANYKCVLRGVADIEMLKGLPQVQSMTHQGSVTTLMLDAEVKPTQWIKHLPEDVNFHELSLSRVSLHEIFIDIATDHLPERSEQNA
ncbi:ABC transporter ATP-binding protein [Cytobacillus purgationiresistens]|uniref:ABC-2 type transport system ATP-binding protein n=1 Tax=Cytobacillus purgationiresistens TaxID=863449 RepID=A0ABU0APU3_9BACI|nr:ATP-binding cassette domain-containing protein [Cytobacillus purgationiresistens]MDQ0273218.1 ABC-2 type transport system ATP-binding protein [Cytobacillus purgationiresistens]